MSFKKSKLNYWIKNFESGKNGKYLWGLRFGPAGWGVDNSPE